MAKEYIIILMAIFTRVNGIKDRGMERGILMLAGIFMKVNGRTIGSMGKVNALMLMGKFMKENGIKM